jgi:hypothetical protein
MGQRKQHLIDYAGPPSAPTPPAQRAVSLGIMASVLGAVTPAAGWLVLRSDRGNPFGAVILLHVVIWGAGNVLGLLLGGVGWWRTRGAGLNSGHGICALANTLNWLGLAGLLCVILFS